MTDTDNRILIFDTTLRDGEQSPGASMNLDEKLMIARALEEMKVDVIEAGFPVASNGDFEAVRAVAREIRESTVCGLARASEKDIDRAVEALRPAARARLHTFISTSPLHMKHKLQMDPEDVHNAVEKSVRYARDFTRDVEWSAEDGARSELDFLCRCVETAIKAGASTINIPDTVGYALPTEFAELIRSILNRVPNIDQAVLSVHCHNDLGLAVANSLAAINAGARQVECTVNGLGERAGNAAMEEIVMALRTRRDLINVDTRLVTENITKTSRLVSTVTGFGVQNNKAVVGANAFAHEAGIHQDGVLKNAATYEIMTPESIGLTRSAMVLGKHSGRHAFKKKLEELGYGQMEESSLKEAFERFKDLADKKKTLYDEDIIAVVDDTVLRDFDRIRLNAMSLKCGTKYRPPEAEITLVVDGRTHTTATTGNGPVDAIFNAIKEIFPTQAHLKLYQVHAVTEGTDAQGEVTVRLEEDGRTVNGQGSDTDILVASARAYINALNKLLMKREKSPAPAL